MNNDLFAPVIKRTKIKNGEWWQGDCLELMQHIPTGSVDMILCDLPYGTTQNKWDTVIPFEPLWREYWRVCKSNAAIVLTASQPFTSALVMSNIKNFKYDWVWGKPTVTGVLNAKKQPLRNKEDVLVFYRKQCLYDPQGLIECDRTTSTGASIEGSSSENYGRVKQGVYNQRHTNYPRQLLTFPNERGFHPTQKPVALFEYLIKTYTNKGDLVLDNTAGSGTTAVAAENTGRRWLCIERDADYSHKAINRIKNML